MANNSGVAFLLLFSIGYRTVHGTENQLVLRYVSGRTGGQTDRQTDRRVDRWPTQKNNIPPTSLGGKPVLSRG